MRLRAQSVRRENGVLKVREYVPSVRPESTSQTTVPMLLIMTNTWTVLFVMQASILKVSAITNVQIAKRVAS